MVKVYPNYSGPAQLEIVEEELSLDDIKALRARTDALVVEVAMLNLRLQDVLAWWEACKLAETEPPKVIM